MVAEEQIADPKVQLLHDRRQNFPDRIKAVLDIEFYLNYYNHTPRVSRELKHSSHTLDIGEEGFGFLYPSKRTVEDEYGNIGGSISKNATIVVFVNYQGKKYKFYAQRVWAQKQIIDGTVFYRYGVKWIETDDAMKCVLDYLLASLRKEAKQAEEKI